ncbi:MAG: hypothetical protein IJT83_02155 [Victivallales bacterium]|nr:hypothetical protein [Victivallales bacterium]
MKTFFSLLLISTLLFGAETLNLNFAKDREVTVDGKSYALDGTVTQDGFMAFGAKGFSFPVKGFLGDNQGSLFFECRFDEPLPPHNTMRTLVQIRTHSRLTVGFHSFASKKYVFAFTDRSSSFIHTFAAPYEPGHTYMLGFTWDGNKVRIYQDGHAIDEKEQPLPMAKVGDLNIGPYKDRWLAPKPWADDSAIKSLRIYDTALTPQEVAALCSVELKPLPETHPMHITIPPLPANVKAPSGDGVLDEEAWKYAASMPRVIRGNFPRQSGALPPHDFKLLYDKDNLYVGFSTLFPPHVPLIEGNLRTPEAEPEVWGTESVEFYIENADELYRFTCNVAGGYGERKGKRQDWTCEWTYKGTKAMKIDDSILWSGEMVIPWKSIGLAEPPKEPRRINFCRSWKLPDAGCHSSLNIKGTGYLREEMIQADFAPLATLQFTKHNNPNNGEYEQEFRIASQKGGNVIYELAVAKMDGTAVPLPIYTKRCTLKPGEVFQDNTKTAITYTDYDCLLYTLTDNGKLSMREMVPYQLDENFFDLVPLFLKGIIRVTLKRPMMLSKLGASFVGTIRLQDEKGQSLATIKTSDEKLELPFDRNFPSGTYFVVLEDKEGKACAKKQLFYPGHGEWEKMEFPEDLIIPPFTPMVSTAADGALTSSLAMRKYEWRNSLLPVQITSLDEGMLAIPAELLINGKPAKTTSFAVGTNKPHHVDFTTKGSNESGSFSGKSWLEYDGIQWNEVEVTHSAAKGSVALRFTLDARYAKYLHTANGGGWGSKITRAIPDGELTVPYFPVIWIGNEEKGLCFFAESRLNWKFPSNRTYTIVKQGGTVTLTVHVTEKEPANKPETYGFGLLATPIRPFAENYPLDTLGWSYAAPMNRPGRRPTSYTVLMVAPAGVKGGDLGSYFADTNDHDAELRANVYDIVLKEQCCGHNVRPFPYLCGHYLSQKYPEMMAYRPEWSFRPELAMDYNGTSHFIYDCCPASSGSAFFAYKAKKLLERYPEMQGLYFDFGNIVACSNSEHGCHGRIPLLAQREFYRRMCIIQLQVGIKSPINVIHNTDCNLLPTYTFTSHLLNGEQVRQASSTLLHNKKDILDTYGIEMFASELSSLPFGVTNSVYMPLDKLSKQNGGDEETAPYQFRLGKAEYAATLIHNTIICLWRNHFGIADKVVRTFDRFGVDKARFVGYWREPAKVTGASDIYVSCHVRDNKVLAVIGHVGKPHVNQTFEVTFDWAKLGVTIPPKNAVDTMTAPDPEYDELFAIQKANKVPPTRAPLELGDFGSKLLGFDGNTLKFSLDFHCFAIVELK